MATATSPRSGTGVITSVDKANGGTLDADNIKKGSDVAARLSAAQDQKRSSIRNSVRDSIKGVGNKLQNLLAPSSEEVTKMVREHSAKVEKKELTMRQQQPKGGLFACCFKPVETIPMIGAELTEDLVGLKDEPREFIPKKPLLPPQRQEHKGKITLLLDLDETLVHSSFVFSENADYAIPLEIDGQMTNVYVKKRPYVDYFLREVGKHFEVVIFTASLPLYADPLLDKLDKHKVIVKRLYREHCVFTSGLFVKDMTLLGRDITKVILIDNAPYTYAFQPENALPCTSWISDETDDELNDILHILEMVKSVPDVRNCRL